MRRCGWLFVLVVLFGVPRWAGAQVVSEAEVAGGGAWFLDDSAIGHSLVGGSVRWWVTPRLAIGPEFTYWRGPGSDRDQTLTGNVTYAFRTSGVTPFVVAGAGIFRHSQRFANDTFSSTEGGWTAGGGVRMPLGSGWYLAPEVRTGWEPHLRIHVGVGKRF